MSETKNFKSVFLLTPIFGQNVAYFAFFYGDLKINRGLPPKQNPAKAMLLSGLVLSDFKKLHFNFICPVRTLQRFF